MKIISATRLAVIAAVVAVLGQESVGFAQSESNSASIQPERKQRRPFAEGPQRFTPGFERVLGVLTEQQRASMRQATVADREKVRELEEKIRNTRRELFELGLREKFDEAAVCEKANTAAKLDADMMVLRVKAISQIRPPLTAEQIQKIRSSPAAEMAEPQAEAPRRRRDIPRDENGLPLKEQPQKSGAEQK
jgi:Spy/CpxP family protein refolding chaperone